MKIHKTKIPNGYEIDKESSTFETIVFKEIKSNYPTNIEDVKGRDYFIIANGNIHRTGGNDPNQVSTKERAKAFLALMQLVELRDAWNAIDGGVEWDYNSNNYIIHVYGGKIELTYYRYSFRPLHFRKRETRDLFFEIFKDLIEQARELI